MIINNVNIVNHDGIIKGSIEFDKDKIINVYKKQVKGINGNNLYLIPSFVDTHSHGAVDFDFNDLTKSDNPKNSQEYINYLVNDGVGVIIGTTVTCSKSDLEKISKNIKNFANRYDIVKGWYIEGPYISKEKKGAHNPKLICPLDMNLLSKINKSLPKDFVKIVAVAPEVFNNIKKIKELSKNYFVALAHSNATAEVATQAIKEGCSRVTHLYNAMSGFHHRNPGVLNAVFNNKKVFVELITDAFTVNNTAALNAYNILNPYQLMIITDTLRCAGCKNGKYSLGSLKIIKNAQVAFREDGKTLAGSVLSFSQQAKNFANLTNCSMQDFVKFTSYNAARSLKLDNKYGVIKKNAASNFLLINKKFNIIKKYYKGQEVK